MNENYSERINEIAAKPKHLISSDKSYLEEAKGIIEHSFIIEYEIPNSNGIISMLVDVNAGTIENIKYITNINSAALAFLDTLVNFLLGKNANTVQHITLREIEYYLRDKNSTPSMPDNGAQMHRIFEVVNQIQKKLHESVNINSDAGGFGSPTFEEYSKSGKRVFDSTTEGKFEDLSQVAQAEIINRVLDVVVNPMLAKDGGAAECAHIMDSNLIVIKYLGNCSDCSFSLTTTMDYIQDVFRAELDNPVLMVMTDS